MGRLDAPGRETCVNSICVPTSPVRFTPGTACGNIVWSGWKPQMTLPLFEDVVLTRDLPEEGLKAGDVGTVVERHEIPGHEVGYSVEFIDMGGGTVALVTVAASLLRASQVGDRPAVRALDRCSGVGNAGAPGQVPVSVYR